MTTKTTTETSGINSAGINAIIDSYGGEVPVEVSTTGTGDSKLTLYRWADRFEVINTNGDPVNENEEGFEDMKAQIVGE